MKTRLAVTAVCLALQIAAAPAQAQQPQGASAKSHQPTTADTRQQAEIENVLKSYEQALNAGDVKGVMKLYTNDAVLMPQETPTVVGTKAVEQFYVGTFRAIDIKLKFQIAEVQVLSNEWAFLRSTATGVVKILANGAEVPSGTQELFVLRKDAGQWKFARYSFSSTLPPAKKDAPMPK